MQINYTQILAVAIGGMLGSVLRFISGFYIVQRVNNVFPWSTLIINVAGSLLIGIVFGVFGKLDNDQQLFSNENWRLLLGTGFCGGFTNFSALSNEGFELIKQQQYNVFFIYFTASVVLGVLATAIGFLITR